MSGGEVKHKKDKPYWAPFLIALIMFLALIAIYIDPNLLSLSKYGLDFETLMNIGYLVIVVMLCLMFIWKITLSTEVEAEVASTRAHEAEVVEGESIDEEEEPSEEPRKRAKPRPKRVVVKTPDMEEEQVAKRVHEAEEEEELALADLPRMVEYPKKEPGGVYSDTLVRVDENLILNLRTLLGKVCHNCEDLEDCKRRVAGKLDDEVFLFNFECKTGLKRELHRARKVREAKKAKEAKEKVEDLASEKVKKKASPSKGKKRSTSAKGKKGKRKAPSKK